MKFQIVRGYRDTESREIVEIELTLDEARAHCRDPETSSSTCKSPEGVARTKRHGPWFEGYEREEG